MLSADSTNPRLLNQLLFTGTNNIAQKFGIASQGSDYGSSVAAFAIDGDENTINHTGCNADNNWWQVKLPEPSLISRIVVKNRSSWRSRLSGSRVYVTTTSYTAGELSESDKVATLDSADIREISVFPKKSATYVIVKAADGNCLHMRELEVYGDVPATPYFNEHKDSYLIPSTSPIGFSVATIGAGDWQGDVLHFSITSDVPFAINTQGQLTVNNTLVANTSYAFDVRVSDGEHSITSAITIKTTTATAVDDAIASGSVSNITSQELLNAAIDEIDASAIAMLDAKVQLFNLNADGSAKDAGSLTAITWDPTHDASLFKPTIGKNVSVLKTNSVTNESYTVYKKDIAIIGDTDNARYMVMGSNPMRNAYRNAAAMNEQMHQFMENSLSWLTKRNDLKTQPFNVVIAHMRQSYYFPDEIATREWLDGHYTGQVSYNAADVCDGDQLSSCLDTSPDLLIISQYPSDNDDNTAIAQRVEQAIDAGTPVLYLHYDGGQTELGKALFPIFNVSYEWDNYWNKLSLSNYDVTQQLTTLPDRLVKIKTLLEHFKAADFAIDWAACDEGNCNAVPSLVTGFFEGASEVKSIMQNLDKAKINIFAESGYRLQKLLVLIGDHFRQNVVFPMDRITTNDTQFLESYFAEHAAYNYRLLNPAQPDMGNYSRSDFSHITPTNRTVNIISKRYFRSTGAYALPGKTFTVTRNDNSDLTVKVFIHSARDGATRIFENKGYVRPRITQSTHIEIKSGETLKLTSATGGPIHLEFSANDLPVEVMFSNIGEHPYWSSSADDARFAQALIDAKYDWAEVVTSGFEVHSTLTKMVKSVNDPKWGSAAAMAAAVTQYTSNYPHVLAGFKGPGIDVVPEIHDFAAEKGWTINSIDIVKHMNADQAACGYGCSGNPYDAYWSFDPIGHGDIHELGHSLQGRKRFIGWENHSMTNHYAYYTQSKYNAAVGSNAHTCQSLSFAQEFTLLQASIGQADPAAYMKTQLWDSADWNKQVSMYIQMLMSAEDNGAVKNGWHVRARLHILEREFYRADNNETDWLAKRDSLGFSNYTLEEAKAADNNDWLLIAISTVTARDYRDYLTMWGIPFSAKADAQVASYNYPIIPRKFYMSSATGYCEAKQNGDFLAKISLPVDGTQTWPTETDDDADGVWNALDNCPADANSDQQDTDNDGLGNVCDTTPTPTVDDTPEADVDSDKDGLPDAWENQYGLNPLDASDANADLDGDGMSNLEEFTNNSDPTKDTVNPVITLPEATTVLQAKGFKTKFAWDLLGKISAEDAHDGKLTATLTKVNEKAPKLRNNGNQLLLAAGKNRLTWTANDKAGNTINVEQMLYVLPRADFSIDQVGNEGETLTVTVSLNGVAPAYPVVIPFTLSGSAEQGADLDYILSTTVHEITINEPATGERPTGRLTVHLLDDGIAESTETLLFSMAETLTYATRGNKRQHRIKILANDLDDLPPKARIQVMQAGKKGKRVYQDNGIVTLTVKAKDPNKDALTYVWGDSLTDLKRDNNPATLEFDPTQLSVGRHEIAVTVSDGTHSIEIEKRIKVKAGNLTLPEASVDTDGDGKKDIDELGDENENGIADYLEDSQQGSHQLSTSDDNPIETTTGLLFELGDFAQHQDDPSSCQINEEDIKNYLNSFGKPVYQTDIAHTPILLLDYVINGLEEIGDSVQIIFSVPALPANAAIRKYSVDKGWQAFMVTDDGKNLIESLISTDGNCPNDESVVYQTGLLEGADCIRLTIEDGGVNDADDKVNGAIEDPVSVSTESSTTTTSTDTTPSGNDSSNGGGGVIPFYWFLFMGLLLLLRSYYINSKGNGSAR
ncbi:MAG TPA: hypothetical protein ENJ33_08225 [Thiothrix sp.]|nr:hypothetical protein [Thiothrix sp.]